MKNNTLIDMTNWTGRVDLEDGELGLRWHQKITAATSSSTEIGRAHV